MTPCHGIADRIGAERHGAVEKGRTRWVKNNVLASEKDVNKGAKSEKKGRQTKKNGSKKNKSAREMSCKLLAGPSPQRRKGNFIRTDNPSQLKDGCKNNPQ